MGGPGSSRVGPTTPGLPVGGSRASLLGIRDALRLLLAALLHRSQKNGAEIAVDNPLSDDLSAVINAVRRSNRPAGAGRNLRLQIDHQAVLPQHSMGGEH